MGLKLLLICVLAQLFIQKSIAQVLSSGVPQFQPSPQQPSNLKLSFFPLPNGQRNVITNNQPTNAVQLQFGNNLQEQPNNIQNSNNFQHSETCYNSEHLNNLQHSNNFLHLHNSEHPNNLHHLNNIQHSNNLHHVASPQHANNQQIANNNFPAGNNINLASGQINNQILPMNIAPVLPGNNNMQYINHIPQVNSVHTPDSISNEAVKSIPVITSLPVEKPLPIINYSPILNAVPAAKTVSISVMNIGGIPSTRKLVLAGLPIISDLSKQSGLRLARTLPIINTVPNIIRNDIYASPAVKSPITSTNIALVPINGLQISRVGNLPVLNGLPVTGISESIINTSQLILRIR